MIALQVDIRGLEEFEAAMWALGGAQAERVLQQTIDRMGRSVAKSTAEDIAAQIGVDVRVLRKRVVWIPGSTTLQPMLRFMGTGKHGAGFIRPRHLGLAVPRTGTFLSGKPRFGRPTTSIPGTRTYPNGFAMVPGKGSKASARWRRGDNRLGRNLKPWKGGAAGASKVTLFQRGPSGERYPISQVPGIRMAQALALPAVAQRAQAQLVEMVTNEILRRTAVELEKAKARR